MEGTTASVAPQQKAASSKPEGAKTFGLTARKTAADQILTSASETRPLTPTAAPCCCQTSHPSPVVAQLPPAHAGISAAEPQHAHRKLMEPLALVPTMLFGGSQNKKHAQSRRARSGGRGSARVQRRQRAQRERTPLDGGSGPETPRKRCARGPRSQWAAAGCARDIWALLQASTGVREPRLPSRQQSSAQSEGRCQRSSATKSRKSDHAAPPFSRVSGGAAQQRTRLGRRGRTQPVRALGALAVRASRRGAAGRLWRTRRGCDTARKAQAQPAVAPAGRLAATCRALLARDRSLARRSTRRRRLTTLRERARRNWPAGCRSCRAGASGAPPLVCAKSGGAQPPRKSAPERRDGHAAARSSPAGAGRAQGCARGRVARPPRAAQCCAQRRVCVRGVAARLLRALRRGEHVARRRPGLAAPGTRSPRLAAACTAPRSVSRSLCFAPAAASQRRGGAAV